MFGLTCAAVVGLAVALGLALLGSILIQRTDGVGDFFGLIFVVAGVDVAALTDTRRARS